MRVATARFVCRGLLAVGFSGTNPPFDFAHRSAFAHGPEQGRMGGPEPVEGRHKEPAVATTISLVAVDRPGKAPAGAIRE